MPETFDLEATDPALPSWVRRVWPAERSVLHGIGTPDWSKPALSIIGTTRPEPIARTWAFELGREAAARGWSVVSGLALGVDNYAHEGAIAGGGHTLAVISQGIDSRLLNDLTALATRIVRANGAILSISEPGDDPTRERLLLRNKWTSAFGIGAIAVQARGRNGTLATMRHAVLQGRLAATFQPPSEADPEQWNGNSLLLSEVPPWRLRESSVNTWKPAFCLTGSGSFDDLFSALSAQLEKLQSQIVVDSPATPSQRQLFEERPQYGDS
ncbi:hypothetical protein BH09CHL1_BH09CHL1_33500 [soil metagenome]